MKAIIIRKFKLLSNNIVSELIAIRNSDILELYKKYKKIPKHMKNLID